MKITSTIPLLFLLGAVSAFPQDTGDDFEVSVNTGGSDINDPVANYIEARDTSNSPASSEKSPVDIKNPPTGSKMCGKKTYTAEIILAAIKKGIAIQNEKQQTTGKPSSPHTFKMPEGIKLAFPAECPTDADLMEYPLHIKKNSNKGKNGNGKGGKGKGGKGKGGKGDGGKDDKDGKKDGKKDGDDEKKDGKGDGKKDGKKDGDDEKKDGKKDGDDEKKDGKKDGDDEKKDGKGDGKKDGKNKGGKKGHKGGNTRVVYHYKPGDSQAQFCGLVTHPAEGKLTLC